MERIKSHIQENDSKITSDSYEIKSKSLGKNKKSKPTQQLVKKDNESSQSFKLSVEEREAIQV